MTLCVDCTMSWMMEVLKMKKCSMKEEEKKLLSMYVYGNEAL